MLSLAIFVNLLLFEFYFRSRSFSVPRYTPVVEVSSTTGLPKTAGPPPEPAPTKTKRLKKVKSHKKKKSHRSKSSQIETVFKIFVMMLNHNIIMCFYV